MKEKQGRINLAQTTIVWSSFNWSSNFRRLFGTNTRKDKAESEADFKRETCHLDWDCAKAGWHFSCSGWKFWNQCHCSSVVNLEPNLETFISPDISIFASNPSFYPLLKSECIHWYFSAFSGNWGFHEFIRFFSLSVQPNSVTVPEWKVFYPIYVTRADKTRTRILQERWKISSTEGKVITRKWRCSGGFLVKFLDYD